MYRIIRLSVLATACCMSALPAFAEDARSMALGGSVIANGKGAHGALANPASMMAMKRRGEKLHLRFGISGEVRDTGSAIDTLTDSDNEDLITDVDSEINTLSETDIECNPINANPDDTCVSGTQNLSDLTGRLLDILDLIDGEKLEGQIRGDFGVAYTQSSIPFAVHIRTSATGSGQPNIGDVDREYLEEFETLLDGNAITYGEVTSGTNTYITNPSAGQPLTITQPQDILQSEATGEALLRAQFGVSIAKTFALNGIDVDIGITPKFSSLTAFAADFEVSDEFDDNTESAADRFEDSEVSKSSFTFDVGGSTILTKFSRPIGLSAVLKNVVPESIKTADGFKFETNPQLIVGASYDQGMVTFTGDLALNAAKVDNFETQKLALGVEFSKRWFALRGGLSHDASRKKDATSLSLGFALGPLEFGGRITGAESLEAGMQLAFSFK